MKSYLEKTHILSLTPAQLTAEVEALLSGSVCMYAVLPRLSARCHINEILSGNK